MQGITTVNLYDNKYTRKNVTPFCKFKIYNFDENNIVLCNIILIDYKNIKYLTANDNFLKSILGNNAILIYSTIENEKILIKHII